jgi:LPS-assembly lipoprotein
MLSNLKWFFIFFSLPWLLSGCGFHLRGPTELPPPLKNVYLQTQQPYGELTKDLTQYLTLSGAHLTNSASQADTILVIKQESTDQQLLGVGGTQQTRQYNLILTVAFEITNKQGVVLVPLQALSETRTLAVQANQILGSSNETTNLYQQMRRTIVYNIMNRLASKETAILLKK